LRSAKSSFPQRERADFLKVKIGFRSQKKAFCGDEDRTGVIESRQSRRRFAPFSHLNIKKCSENRLLKG
jgi:hypothetical protein